MRKLALFMAGLMASGSVQAAPVLLNQWYTFGFGGTGSALVSGSGFVLGTNPAALEAPDAPWTFDLPSVGSLTVLDGFNSGDQFEIMDFGGSIGLTSAPVRGFSCGSDITACLGTPEMSKANFLLAAGSHSISGTAVLSPFGGGAGFFKVSVRAVPEPSTWALLVMGFGAVGMAMRARRRVNVSFA